MSRLDELIKQYCPNGVPFCVLNTICKVFDGTHTTPDYLPEGIQFASVENIKNPYNSKKYISQEAFDKYKYKPQIGDVLMTRIGSIGQCYVIERDSPLAYYVSLALLRPDKAVLNSKYLKYFIESSIGKRELGKRTLVNAVPIKINKDDIGKIIIPIPPLPVQEEIVRILDAFTKLEAKLEEELEARKKQYEHYRETLLTFGDDVPFEMLNNVFEMRNGYTPSKANPEYWTEGTIPWIRMEDIRANGGILYDAIQKVNKCAIKSGKLFPKGTIAFATSATIGVHCLLMTDCLTNQRFTAIYPKPQYRDKLIPKFIYFIGFIIDKYCLEHQQVSSMPSVDMNAFKEYPFPIPPLAEQEHIVSILDKFDTLCNDLTQGLPKELELHRKQYEYYRDKLLTFQRKDA